MKLSFWYSPKRFDLYMRWSFLVILNAAFPFILSLQIAQTPSHLLGILLAIITFIFAYAEVDFWLLKQKHHALAKQLRVSAAIKVSTLIFPFIDIFTGIIALDISRLLTGINITHYDVQTTSTGSYSTALESVNIAKTCASYLTTMINGILLSLIVIGILFIIRVISKCLYKRNKTVKFFLPKFNSKYKNVKKLTPLI